MATVWRTIGLERRNVGWGLAREVHDGQLIAPKVLKGDVVGEAQRTSIDADALRIHPGTGTTGRRKSGLKRIVGFVCRRRRVVFGDDRTVSRSSLSGQVRWLSG